MSNKNNSEKGAGNSRPILTISDFDRLREEFLAEGLSFPNYLIWLKRNRDYLKAKDFWHSTLSGNFLPEILASDEKEKFLEQYFSSDENCNPELNKRLSELETATFMRFFKIFGLHRSVQFWNWVRDNAGTNEVLLYLKAESAILLKSETAIKSQEAADYNYLLRFPVDQVLFGFSLWHQYFLCSKEVMGNDGLLTSIEMALANEISDYLKYWVANNEKGIRVHEFKNQDDLDRQWYYYSPRRLGDPPKPIDVPVPPAYQLILKIVDRIIDRRYRKSTIEQIEGGLLSLVLENGKINTIETPAFQEYWINDKKSQYEDIYTSKASDLLENLGKSRIENFAKLFSSIDSCLSHFDFYALPHKVTTHEATEIDFHKVFSLLKHFAEFKGPPRRNHIPAIGNLKEPMVMIGNEGPPEFVKLFGPNSYFAIFDLNELVVKVSQYFIWTVEETNNILNFLSTDLDTGIIGQSWLGRPFIKHNGKYFWVGRFLRERKWERALEGRIRREKFADTSVNQISSNFEARIGNLFREAGFKILVSKKFKSKNNVSGDIDVLAYKNGFLFLIEAKNVLGVESFTHAQFIEALRFEGAAVYQLDKISNFIEEEWDKVREWLGLKESSVQEVTIAPLIVSSSFEGDLKVFKGYYKVSLLEIEVILKNNAEKLYPNLMVDLFHLSRNINNPKFKGKPGNRKKIDLWKGAKTCSPEILIECIVTERVWDRMKEDWVF